MLSGKGARAFGTAMIFRGGITCPKCGESHRRASKWLSRQEKLSHPDSRPYRCLVCSHRFRIPASPLMKYARPAAVAALSLLALAPLAGAWWWAPEAPAPEIPAAAPSVVDPDELKAAAAGDANAQFKVGEILLREALRTRSESAPAVRWLQLAAENGDTRAMVRLGKLHRSGVGALQNFNLAAKWLQLAASRGDVGGMLELGRLYREGIGLEKDPLLAYVWFNRAAAAHELDAARERDETARDLSAEQLKNAQQQSSAAEAAGRPSKR